MKISIIVPIYNVKKYLKNCVSSILTQTYKDIEIILVDDGSTDGSAELCDELSRDNDKVRVVHKENGGLSSARNTGMKYATGEYIGFVDSDDTIDNRMYETLIKEMQANNADIGICGRYYVFEDGNKFVRYKNNSKLIMNSEEAIEEMNSFRSFDMAAWDKLYKKELFNDIEFPEKKLSEDFFIMYKLFDKANVIFYTPEPLYNYLQRQNSISHNKKVNHDFIEAAREQMMFVEKKYPKLKIKMHVAYISAIMTVYNFYLKANQPMKEKLLKEFRIEVENNYKYIVQDKDIRKSKKLQAFLFIHSIVLYKIMFKIYKLVDKV